MKRDRDFQRSRTVKRNGVSGLFMMPSKKYIPPKKDAIHIHHFRKYGPFFYESFKSAAWIRSSPFSICPIDVANEIRM